jgi:phenylpyruvate tautomerase PptA (4-oxalocrotonate tautomerase family)
MLDVYIPEDALTPTAEAALMNTITEILIRHEGFDPNDALTRSVSWVFLHRPVAVFVGGQLAEAPHYKVVPSVPEGQLGADLPAAIIGDITEAILDAENGRWPRDPGRVWVFPTEIPEGRWGAMGKVRPLATILSRLLRGGDAAVVATQRINASRAARTRLTETI